MWLSLVLLQNFVETNRGGPEEIIAWQREILGLWAKRILATELLGRILPSSEVREWVFGCSPVPGSPWVQPRVPPVCSHSVFLLKESSHT